MASRHWILPLDLGYRALWFLHRNASLALHYPPGTIQEEHDGVPAEFVLGSHSDLV